MLTPRTPRVPQGGFARESISSHRRLSHFAPPPPRQQHAPPHAPRGWRLQLRRPWLLGGLLLLTLLASVRVITEQLADVRGAADTRLQPRKAGFAARWQAQPAEGGAGAAAGAADDALSGQAPPLAPLAAAQPRDVEERDRGGAASPTASAADDSGSDEASPRAESPRVATVRAAGEAAALPPLPPELTPAALYTCAPGAAGQRWSWTPGGRVTLLRDDGDAASAAPACLSTGDGEDVRLLGLGACDGPRALSFAPRGAQLVVSAGPHLAAGACLHAWPGATQGEALQLRPCGALQGEHGNETPPAQSWDMARLPQLVSAPRGLCATAGGGPCGAARFCLSNALGSHMVLQRAPQSAALWGFAPPGDVVTCTLATDVEGGGAEATVTAHVAFDGTWQLSLPPQPPGGPHVIACSTAALPDATVTLEDVLFGDVYLCGGQSNMVMPARLMINGSAEIEEADRHPSIRLFSVGQGTAGSGAPGLPLAQLGTVQLPWAVASAATVGGAGDGDWSTFSAVCWVAGRTLSQRLGGAVPLGLLVSAWGGTCLELWADDAALRRCGLPTGAGLLYDAMIAPLAPMRLAGVWFYQGESNVGTPDYHRCFGWGAPSYGCQLPALVAAWRRTFGDARLFFAFVQLSPYSSRAPGSEANRTALASLRAAQAAAALALPRAAMVTAADQGDAASPHRDIHPRHKAAVGARLAAATAAELYGLDAPWRSPVLEAAVLAAAAATAPHAVRARFRADTLGGGLALRPEPPCPAAVHPLSCAGWQLQAPDGAWHAAAAALAALDEVAVSAPAALRGAPPTAVRYGFADFPLLSLYSADGLPALPFEAQLAPLADTA